MAEKVSVFISYARFDGRDEAESLYQELAKQNIGAWYDKRNIEAGQDFSAEIEEGIENASHVAVCVTPGSKRADSFVRNEIQYARMLKKPIIPLRFADIPPQVTISTYTFIDFFRDWDKGIAELLEWLNRPVSSHEHPASPAEIDPFRRHVEQLNQFTVRILKQTVFNAQVVMLRSEDAPDAITQESIPAIYQTQLPTWFEEPDSAPEEFDSFTSAFGFHEGRVLLLGAPGSGKSTTLLAFARDKAYERLENPKALLPVYAPISRWDGSSALIDWLAKETGLNKDKLQTEIDTGHTLLLLDGLDELPDEVPTPINRCRARVITGWISCE